MYINQNAIHLTCPTSTYYRNTIYKVIKEKYKNVRAQLACYCILLTSHNVFVFVSFKRLFLYASDIMSTCQRHLSDFHDLFQTFLSLYGRFFEVDFYTNLHNIYRYIFFKYSAQSQSNNTFSVKFLTLAFNFQIISAFRQNL